MDTEHYPVPCALGEDHVVGVTYDRHPEVIVGLHCTCDDVGESVERLGGLSCMTTLQGLRTYLRLGVAGRVRIEPQPFGSPLSDDTRMNILYSQISRVRVAVNYARNLVGTRSAHDFSHDRRAALGARELSQVKRVRPDAAQAQRAPLHAATSAGRRPAR